ncbi:MAG: transketolase [Armatimonadota bacterium]
MKFPSNVCAGSVPVPSLTEDKTRELEQVAQEIRRLIIKTLHKSGAGHPGGSLSLAEILSALYFHVMKVDPQRPDWMERDRLVLSKGHASAALYTALCLRGYLDKQCLQTFDCVDSILQGHPDMLKTKGVDMSSGSLGQGLSVGIGMALGMRRRNINSRAYVILGDGELQEGQVWEAAMYAGSRQVDNVIAIIDFNTLQIMGAVNDVMNVNPIVDKWTAFGWRVLECDGNSIPEVVNALQWASTSDGKPSVIVAHTIKGKGVSFMEGNIGWHSKVISDDEMRAALLELGDRADDCEC